MDGRIEGGALDRAVNKTVRQKIKLLPTKMTPEVKVILDLITDDQRRDFKARLDQPQKVFEDNNLPEQMADSIEIDLNQWYKEEGQ